VRLFGFSTERLLKPSSRRSIIFPGIKDSELPRYVLICDFQTFELYDLDTRWNSL